MCPAQCNLSLGLQRHPFGQQRSACSVPGTGLGTGNAAVDNQTQICPGGAATLAHMRVNGGGVSREPSRVVRKCTAPR